MRYKFIFLLGLASASMFFACQPQDDAPPIKRPRTTPSLIGSAQGKDPEEATAIKLSARDTNTLKRSRIHAQQSIQYTHGIPASNPTLEAVRTKHLAGGTSDTSFEANTSASSQGPQATGLPSAAGFTIPPGGQQLPEIFFIPRLYPNSQLNAKAPKQPEEGNFYAYSDKHHVLQLNLSPEIAQHSTHIADLVRPRDSEEANRLTVMAGFISNPDAVDNTDKEPYVSISWYYVQNLSCYAIELQEEYVRQGSFTIILQLKPYTNEELCVKKDFSIGALPLDKQVRKPFPIASPALFTCPWPDLLYYVPPKA